MAEPNSEQQGDWAELSSMSDGEAGPEAHERCLALWAADAQARARWRSYQLIGDVLRSQELAQSDRHDAAFLGALRERLQREPVVLRPQQAVRSPRAWGVSVAAVAGVAAVAVAAVALRTLPESAAPMMATGSPDAAAAATVATTPSPTPQAVNGRLIRDTRLDRYFAAHRQSGNGTALQMPGAAVRNVDTIVLEER